MKLITAIVNKDDSNAVQSGLTGKGFPVTRIATTGGFLMAGNVTFILGVDDDKVDEVIETIAEQSRQRQQLVPPTSSYGMGVTNAMPLEVTMGGATVFVQNIERFEKM
jgi:uncharacterized protein YaaQ